MRRFFFLFTYILIFNQALWAQSTKPNVLLVLVDDLGYNDVSYYNTEDVQTPHIDALCGAGIRFDGFYANSPVCSPTRAALMSGQHPDAVGVPGLIRYPKANNWGYLKPEATLMPAVLKNAGYATAMVGKWNLGLESPNLPNQKGFDYFHGWLEDMMEDYYGHRRHGINFMRENEKVVDPEGHATDIFTDWSIDYIEKAKGQAKPFFLYLAYNAPHFPVQPPEEWLQKVLTREKGIDPKRAKLVALIEHLDYSLGRVVDALKATGQYENTLILFMSDNGGNLEDLANNLPYRDGKQSMYEGGIRVPAFALWPARIKAGIVSDEKLMTMDVLPTLADLVQGETLTDCDGKSFKSILLNEKAKMSERPIYFVRREGGMKYGGNDYHAMIYQGWKILQNTPYSPLELYRLQTDPYEKVNLAEQEPKKLMELNKLMMTFIQQGGRTPWQKP
ncbi:sulfatase-like hydrolase/transferase [Marinilongibacter aquaticus]|uniref:sulfatase-like hydrolase/transferase n=1 Tax=Marinilongibacter aquaticus TaxID=2975157 RepID=UPI0021BD702A|nr:sulfatase-like hydrolase/transferase [Marinilongibacter aquaticus]UBM59920.1 sulfatase-like hydrolase/transferase [Marinilongibacter aquaticus]